MKVPHILVIDDEKEITDLIEIYLNQEGYEVVKRYNAFTLIQDIERYKIDLVILDMMLPEIDGLQALEYIRERFNIPVIIVSAKSSDNDKIEGTFYVFYDKLQLVQSFEIPKFIERADCRLTLYKNCRNTKRLK